MLISLELMIALVALILSVILAAKDWISYHRRKLMITSINYKNMIKKDTFKMIQDVTFKIDSIADVRTFTCLFSLTSTSKYHITVTDFDIKPAVGWRHEYTEVYIFRHDGCFTKMADKSRREGIFCPEFPYSFEPFSSLQVMATVYLIPEDGTDRNHAEILLEVKTTSKRKTFTRRFFAEYQQ